jgi:hypothetical protein
MADPVQMAEMIRFFRALIFAEMDVLTRPLLNRVVEADIPVPAGFDNQQLMEVLRINTRNMRTFLTLPTPQTSYNSS